VPAVAKAVRRPHPVARKVSLDLIHQAALTHSLSPALVEAVARVESGLNPRAVSPKGARGLLQLMPATARRFGVRTDRLFEPEHNLAAGAAYLAWLMERYDDNLDFALAAYNAGEGAVDDYGGIPPYRETQDYVRRVRAALRSIEEKALPLPDPAPVEEEKKEEVEPKPAAPLAAGGR
jgi:soluble lytic murein transglycosylase-like protein